MNQADKDNTQAMISHIWECRIALPSECILLVHFTDEHAAPIGSDSFNYCTVCGCPYFTNNVPANCDKCGQQLILINASNEAQTWQWLKKIGVSGIMYQDDREDNDAVASRVGDFTVRFGNGINGWPTGMWFFLFERGTESKYNKQRDVAFWNDLNNNVLSRTYEGMQITGWCSGR
jgi:hypothetical protein